MDKKCFSYCDDRLHAQCNKIILYWNASVPGWYKSKELFSQLLLSATSSWLRPFEIAPNLSDSYYTSKIGYARSMQVPGSTNGMWGGVGGKYSMDSMRV